MKHLGDICKINGAEIEPVDVITAGSPCQDLSEIRKTAVKEDFKMIRKVGKQIKEINK